MNPQQILQTIAENLGFPPESVSNDPPSAEACPYSEIDRRRREVYRLQRPIDEFRESLRPFFESLRDRLLDSINEN